YITFLPRPLVKSQDEGFLVLGLFQRGENHVVRLHFEKRVFVLEAALVILRLIPQQMVVEFEPAANRLRIAPASWVGVKRVSEYVVALIGVRIPAIRANAARRAARRCPWRRIRTCVLAVIRFFL